MDQLLIDLLKMDRRSLCSYLFFEYTSNEEFKLWGSGMKIFLLDSNIERMEYLMSQHNSCNAADIRCRACRSALYYLPVEDSIDEVRWMCLNCPNHEILRCKADEVVNALIKVKSISPQLVALTLNTILNNFNRYNCLSQPSVPDNPIDILLLMYERQKEEAFKLGGMNVVIVADIFKSCQSSELLPILYLADTVNIPTRYYLHALTSDISKNLEETATRPLDDAHVLQLLHELIAIANRVIKPNSYLLLGPTLQALIPPRYYNDKVYNFNLRAIVPLTELKLFETQASASSANIDVGLDKILNPALAICSIVNTLLLRKIHKYGTQETLQVATQKYLNTAIWLRMFSGTPFESLLFNIINEEEVA